jgi:hypothetical protein
MIQRTDLKIVLFFWLRFFSIVRMLLVWEAKSWQSTFLLPFPAWIIDFGASSSRSIHVPSFSSYISINPIPAWLWNSNHGCQNPFQPPLRKPRYKIVSDQMHIRYIADIIGESREFALRSLKTKKKSFIGFFIRAQAYRLRILQSQNEKGYCCVWSLLMLTLCHAIVLFFHFGFL